MKRKKWTREEMRWAEKMVDNAGKYNKGLAKAPDRLSWDIKWFRQKLQLSQEELSKKLGVSRTYISHVENAHWLPSYEFIKMLDEMISSTHLRSVYLLYMEMGINDKVRK